MWQALVNDRRFAGRGFKRQVPVGPHITDFVSFPLKCVIDLVPAAEERPAGNRAGARLTPRGYLEASAVIGWWRWAAEVEQDVAAALGHH